MMKKLICAILAAAMLFSVVACTGNSGTATAGSTKTTAPVTAPATAPETEPAPLDAETIARIEQIKAVPRDYAYVGEVSVMELISELPTVFPTAGQHPRVMFTAEDIPAIREHMKAEFAAKEYAEYVRLRDDKSRVDAAIAGDGYVGFDSDEIEAKAFAYAIEGNELCGHEALLLLEAAFCELEYMDTDVIDVEDYSRPLGKYIYSAAVVYDWCYDLLSDKDKAMLYAGVQNLCAPYMEIGFPPAAKHQSTISSHSSESQLLKEWLALSIAIYDEYPNAYEYVGGRFYEQYVPFRNYYYDSDFYHQGTSYGTYRFIWDLYSDKLISTMCGEHPYNERIKNVVTSFAYAIRPDGYYTRMGDDGKQERFHGLADASLMTAGMYGDPIAQTLCHEYFYCECDDGHNVSPIDFLIFYDPSVPEGKIDELPLVRYMGSPLGQMIARTGWERKDVSSDDIVVLMKIGETYVTNHDHYDSGSFQIYYKGALAIDSGSENSSDYMKRTVAHNAILAFKNKDFTDINYGGQIKLDGECADWSTWSRDRTRRPNKVTAHESLEADGKLEYAYISGKITSYQKSVMPALYRSMLFVPTEDKDNPGIMFVFDNIELKKEEYTSAYLLHMREEPTVDEAAKTVTIKVTDEGYGGKLVNQTLLPADVTYYTIGGDGQSEWLVDEDYRNTDDPISTDGHHDYGWGRVEIRSTGTKDVYNLNVMTIGELDAPFVQAELFENEDCAAAKILGKIAVFTKSDDRRADAFGITTVGDGEFDYYVSGVEAGEWTVTVGGTTLTAVATEDGGMLHFTAPAGDVQFAPAK